MYVIYNMYDLYITIIYIRIYYTSRVPGGALRRFGRYGRSFQGSLGILYIYSYYEIFVEALSGRPAQAGSASAPWGWRAGHTSIYIYIYICDTAFPIWFSCLKPPLDPPASCRRPRSRFCKDDQDDQDDQDDIMSWLVALILN